MARSLRCPSCKTTVTVEPGETPVCPTCGFGREGPPMRSAPAAAEPTAAVLRSDGQGASTLQHTEQARAVPSAAPGRPRGFTSVQPSARATAGPQDPAAPPASAPPAARRPEDVEATGRLDWGSPHVPAATLYDHEEVLVDLETKSRDVGLWHTVLGHKERIVVTSRRVFGFARTRNEAVLRTLEVDKVSAVESGGVFHMRVWATGAALMLLALLVAFVPMVLGLYLGMFSWLGFGVSLGLACVVATAGVLTLLRATEHGVSVHAGSTSVELPLHPARGEEAKRLVDSLQRALRAR